MADSTITVDKIFLRDGFGGSMNTLTSIPVDGLQGKSHHNVSSPIYPVGTKLDVQTANGISTLAYLKVGAQGSSTDAIKAGSICGLHTTSADGYSVSNDKASAIVGGPAAVAISAMTTGNYGWFWVGGPAPLISAVAGGIAATATIPTKNDVAVATGAVSLTGTMAGNVAGLTIGVATSIPVGYTVADDAA